jgi:coproporphyrinogen III oxidase-like Fe-S oxidoreductase
MYQGKAFRIKSLGDLAHELAGHARHHDVRDVRRIFLADGNVTVLGMDPLRQILHLLKQTFPALRRVSAYASPSDLTAKSGSDLADLYALGLRRLYTGIESGDDDVLARNNKGETAASTLAGLMKAREAGFELSVMILLGLGGREGSSGHIAESARLLNLLQPYQISLLVLGYPLGLDHYQRRIRAPFTPLSLAELVDEMGRLVAALELERSHFRCDHGSNFLPLQGVLGRDKAALLSQIEQFARSVPASRKPFLPLIG